MDLCKPLEMPHENIELSFQQLSFLRRLKCVKFFFGQGSRGAYNALLDPLIDGEGLPLSAQRLRRLDLGGFGASS